MEVHYGKMRPPLFHHVIICVQAHQQEVPLLPRQLHTHNAWFGCAYTTLGQHRSRFHQFIMSA